MTGTCDFCGARAPVRDVLFRQNTGLVVVRQYREFAGAACRGCHGELFARTTLHNLVLGWWGVISMLVTPLFLLANAWEWLSGLTLPAATQARRAALADREDYARNLLATKDLETVVEVLAKDTGHPADDVRRWLEGLTAARAA